jgi:hypothetical protein
MTIVGEVVGGSENGDRRNWRKCNRRQSVLPVLILELYIPRNLNFAASAPSSPKVEQNSNQSPHRFVNGVRGCGRGPINQRGGYRFSQSLAGSAPGRRNATVGTGRLKQALSLFNCLVPYPRFVGCQSTSGSVNHGCLEVRTARLADQL